MIKKDELVGEVLNSEGKPTGIHKADALAMLDLLSRIENSVELMRLAGPEHSPWVAINAFLDLFDTPRNIDELWVWNRFRWAFGAVGSQSSTWVANDSLDDLIQATVKLRDLSIEWVNTGRLSLGVRSKLQKQIDKAQLRLFGLLGKVIENLNRWPDSKGFAAFAQR